jgi:hypothetical protein
MVRNLGTSRWTGVLIALPSSPPGAMSNRASSARPTRSERYSASLDRPPSFEIEVEPRFRHRVADRDSSLRLYTAHAD